VLVYVFGNLHRHTGQARIDVRVKPGTTLEGLFQHLAEQYDERFLDACVRRPGERSISVVLLNGHTLHLPRDLQRELKREDVLHLIPPIAGG
jgi:molybdopterin converting factor small subunit